MAYTSFRYLWITFFACFMGAFVVLPREVLSLEDEIFVHLDTENSLQPLYMPPFYAGDSGFDASYIRALEEILEFDLNHNASNRVIPHNKERRLQAKEEGFDGAYEKHDWRKLGAAYVVKMRIKDRKCSVEAFSVNDDLVKAASDLALSGDLSSDRRRMHQIADSLHKAFFGIDGIASTRILYSLQKINKKLPSEQWHIEIWESDYDGANAHQITHEGHSCKLPTYLPPKKGYSSGSFFYVSDQTGQQKIFVASLRDGIGRRLSYLGGQQLMPDVSKARDQVVFICDKGGLPDVFLQAYNPQVGVMGKPRQIFKAHRAVQASPRFGPKGERIVFVSDKDGSPRIYMMEIAHVSKRKLGKPILLTKENRENTCPAWSPDGGKIAYSSRIDGIRQIWVYDVSTGRERPLTQGKHFHKENPTWASDSIHLMFDASMGDLSELHMINLNQSSSVQVSTGEGVKRFPAWEPR